ncbi:CHAT domain-containing protein [Actinoplanes subtropicus]|uniref:CHAT domain-containing protein n=1 Tax=Actinoplanes subtropicus TaxID=543632 RepID=UPI000691EB4E|nr:CHAT domain-containing protein [Actinoplanes subtropicus]
MDDLLERYATIAGVLAGYTTLEEGIRAVRELPPAAPKRGLLAAALVERTIQEAFRAPERHRRSIDWLVAIADTGPPPGPAWRRLRIVARSAAIMMAAFHQDLGDPAAVVAELETLRGHSGDDPALLNQLDLTRMTVEAALSGGSTDLEAVDRVVDRFRKMTAQGGAPNPEAEALAEAMMLMQEMMRAPTAPGMQERQARLMEILGRLPEEHHLRKAVEERLPLLRLYTADADPGDALAAIDRPGVSADDRAIGLSTLSLYAMLNENDPARIDAWIDRLRTTLADLGPGHQRRGLLLVILAGALARRDEMDNRVDRLDEAEALALEARGLVEGRPHDKVWSMAHDILAFIDQRRPAGPDRHRTALDGMRGHLWRVLMQRDLAGAAAVARDAAETALVNARDCLAHGDPAAAVRALEAGRGLALYAAVEMRDVAERLSALGHDRLAERWRREAMTADPDDVPVGLRREVVEALAAAAPAGALLDPPEPAEIAEALTELDADALIYLIPGNGPVTGFGLAVAADGSMTYFALPNLRLAGDDPVVAALSSLARRDATLHRGDVARDLGAAEAETRDLAAGVATLCDWAWRAAIGKVIEQYLPGLGVATGRTPHLVLIPLGELARVPWSAARRAGGEPAVHHVAISQAASARLLCHTAGRPPVRPSRNGLVVGDPATPWTALPGARLEAYEIHQTFYRGSRYLGRRPQDDDVSPSGAGTPAEVTKWLTDPGLAGGGLLHLACHAVADTERGRSYLLLDGGQELAADRLVDLLAGRPDRELGLVVLAGCNTGKAITGYDEAYSLGTAFLAAGARSVLSTQWSIPDGSTSVLMFMVHQFLMVDRRTPWEALRDAQLWMLDPDREIPDRMPAELRKRLNESDPTDITGWAGFVHWGR